MYRDLKTGMVIGLVLGAGLLVWFSGHTGAPVKAGGIEQILVRTRVSDGDVRRGTGDLPGAAAVTEGEKPVRIYPFTQAVAGPRIHVVQTGETLSGISMLYYGSARSWEKILAANRTHIKNPDKLVPRTQLVIPE